MDTRVLNRLVKSFPQVPAPAPAPVPVEYDYGGLILPPGGRIVQPPAVLPPTTGNPEAESFLPDMMGHVPSSSAGIDPALLTPSNFPPTPSEESVVEPLQTEQPAQQQTIDDATSDNSRGNEVIDLSDSSKKCYLKANKSDRRAKNTSSSYKDRLRTYMLDFEDRSPDFKRIVDTPYPAKLLTDKYEKRRQHSVADIEIVPLRELIPASSNATASGKEHYHPLMQKVLADCRLNLPEFSSLLADYERIRHLSRIYRLILLITPDRNQIRQEWIDETLRQHGEKCSKKMANGQKVTARQELHLTRDECQNLLDQLSAADKTGRGYALDVLVSALYNCKVKAVNVDSDEIVSKRIKNQGYQEIRPQNSFFVFARAFERFVSPGENIRQTSLRMYTKIVWRNVLTECQRLLFKAIHEEMNELHLIIHPEYKYAPKPHEPERQQSPVANGEQLSAVPSSSSVSSQSTPAKHANSDANADSRPAKRQCLATEETAVAAQPVITIPEDVPNVAEGNDLDGPHQMGYHSAGCASTVAPFYDPPLAHVDQSDPSSVSLQLQQQYPEDLQLFVHQAALRPPSYTNDLNESTGFSYDLPPETLSQWSDPLDCLLPPPVIPTSNEMDPSLVVDSYNVNNMYAEATRSSDTAAALALPEDPILEDNSDSLDYLFYEMPEDNSDSQPDEIPEDESESESLDDIILDDIIVID